MTVDKLKTQRDLLRDAIQDLDQELQGLQGQKKDIERKLREASSQLDFVKEQEIRLRNLISLSMKKEGLLLKKRQQAKDKLGDLDKRIEKVKAVERELKDV